MAEHIKYEDVSGILIMDALIGNCDSLFAIEMVEDGNYRYLVRHQPVSRKVFLDALKIAKLDRYDPNSRRYPRPGEVPPAAPVSAREAS